MRVEALMKISEFLSPDGVLVDVRESGKVRLLERLSTLAAAAVGLEAGDVAREVAKREVLGSTGVGDGVALPHARLHGLGAPFGLLARLSHSIDFDSIDGKPVDIVFLLLLPEAGDTGKGNALACVARALRQPDTLRQIRDAPDRKALFKAIAGVDTA
jgi:PTS system nitrogen regulatory IIA component